MEATSNSVQERINQKAEDRFQKDLQGAWEAISKNPILAQLKVIVGERKIDLFSYGIHAIFGAINSVHRSKAAYTNITKEYTNFDEIKAELIAGYVQEETDTLFQKIDEIKEYFETREVES